MDAKLQAYIDKLNALNFKEMYNGDFFLTWEKSDDELEAVFTVADALRYMRENNISTKVFESGLGISLFRDNSTRTRFSFASEYFAAYTYPYKILPSDFRPFRYLASQRPSFLLRMFSPFLDITSPFRPLV